MLDSRIPRIDSGSIREPLTSPPDSPSRAVDNVAPRSRSEASEGWAELQACLQVAETSSLTSYLYEGCEMRVISITYTVCLALGSLFWMLFHSYFVVARGDNNLTFRETHRKYTWLYATAFCLPSVDGAIHLAFAVYYAHCHVGMAGEDNRSVAPWNFKLDRPLVRILVLTSSIIVIRFAVLWVGPGSDQGSQRWILAVGSLIEAFPHFSPFLLLYGRTSRMASTIEALSTNIIEHDFLSSRCVAAYKKLAAFIHTKSQAWQVFIVATVISELGIVVVQYIWVVANPHTNELPSIATLTLVEGCYIAFKLWPLVRFNRQVKRFANRLVIKAQETQDEGKYAGSSGLDEVRRAVSTTAILFNAHPPCLTLFGVAVDNTTLVALGCSVLFTSTSSYILKVAKVD